MARHVFLFLLFTGTLTSQQLQRQIDSLVELLDGHRKQDTIRLHLLNEISFDYYSINPSKGLEYAREAIALAQQLNHTQMLAVAYNRKGTNHWARGEDSLAMEAVNKSLALHKQSGNLLNYGKALNNRALNHYNLQDYKAAIQDHEEAAAIFKEINHTAGLQYTFCNIGTVFLTLNDYPRALEAFLNAQRLNTGNTDLQSAILTNLGLVYRYMKEYPKSLEYQQEALEIYQNIGNKQGIANVLSNMATVYDYSNEPEKAIAFYEQAMVINKEIGNDRKIASDLTNIGVVYNKMDQKNIAAGYLQQAVDLYQTTNDKNGLTIALLELAETYDIDIPKKLILQKEALHTAEESGLPLRQSDALKALSHTYENSGNHLLAMNTYRRHIMLRDSIFNEEKSKDILRQQMEFDFEKKEAFVQAEIKRQSTIKKALLLGGSGLMLAFVVGFVLYKRRRDAVVKQKEAEFDALVSETELKALRARMNPHFIFNSLNSIGDYIMKNNIEEAQDYLTKFAGLMRQVLENSEHSLILLSEDLKFIELYLEVESKRLPGRFLYTITVSKDLDTENILVPPLMLQPFIENSIWHGFKTKGQQGHVFVEIKKENGMLVCSVDDDGTGRDPAVTTKKSFGISITQNRLEILNRQRHTSGKLQVIDKPAIRGTKVEISLPLIFSF